jgi:serine/threonine protein phosphatase PrpC
MSDEPREFFRAVLSDSVDIEPFHPPSAALTLDVGAASVCGPARSHNTDHYLAIRLGRLQETLISSLPAADLPSHFEEYGYAMLVADGLGAGGSGARASRVALSTLAHLAIRYGKWNVRIDPETISKVIDQGEFFYRRAHDAVFQASQTAVDLAGMATSLTALYIAQDDLFFAHVGHSRAFLLRNGVLIQLTPDHTVERARRGTAATSHRAPRNLRQVVARTIGGNATGPDVEIERIKLISGDRLLLCTNGLTDVVNDEQIADALAPRRRPQEDCLRLIDLAREKRSHDDVTVMLGDYTFRGETLRSRARERLPVLS